MTLEEWMQLENFWRQKWKLLVKIQCLWELSEATGKVEGLEAKEGS